MNHKKNTNSDIIRMLLQAVYPDPKQLTHSFTFASWLLYEVVQINSTTDGKYTAKFLSECEDELPLWVW